MFLYTFVLVVITSLIVCYVTISKFKENEDAKLENYNKKLLSNNTGLEKSNSEIQSSYVELHATISSLNKSHTELTLRFRALDECCPVTNQLTQARKCSICPKKWLQSKGNCYFFSTDKLNWDDSHSNCRSMNGHLVIIESKEEQTFLINTIKTKEESEENIYWIGLTDQRREGHFVWVDNRPLDFINSFWGRRAHDGKSEPDNWNENNPNGQDCIQLQVNKKYDGWYDGECSDKQMWICEITMA